MKCGRERKKDESRPTVEGDGSTVEFLGYDILLKDRKSSVNVTNNYKLTPVYNFINDRLVDESAVLRPLITCFFS